MRNSDGVIRTGFIVVPTLILILVQTQNSVGVKWLAMHEKRFSEWNTYQNCSKSLGLVKKQVKLCRTNLDLMRTFSHAAYIASKTCQEQFADRRWNCSSLLKVPKLSRDLSRGTREQSYVYAIASSALVHSIARACSLGVTTKCSCGSLPDKPPDDQHKWGGCSDNVRYGVYLTTSFTEASLTRKGKPKTSKKADMNRHNNGAGAQIVSDSLKIACKCHGVSGSCAIKTCFRSMPNFSAVGLMLKDKYIAAVEAKRKRKKSKKVFVPLFPHRQSVTTNTLIYYTKSPDYCSRDPKTGAEGTEGRYCDKGSQGWGGCDILCCGRGYKSFTREIVERCECKYYWCCYVKCKECSKTLHLNVCR
ncbi:protein Wnt-11-like [Mytilus edulis]|uniref:protein Wnt-11-like n=1 Tax=Mytilus edulis TaxID=6550 RepID=UPI0039F02C38